MLIIKMIYFVKKLSQPKKLYQRWCKVLFLESAKKCYKPIVLTFNDHSTI